MLKSGVNRLAIVALGLGLLLVCQSATAAFTWDYNSTGGTADGSGTWSTSTSSLNWWNGVADTSWTSGSLGASFGANPGSNPYTVSLGGGSISASGVTFQNQAYTIGDAGGGTLNLASPTVTVNSAAGGTIASGITITGTGGLTKAGSGALTLNSRLAYTGTTAVSSGTLEFNNSSGTIGQINVASGGTAYFHNGSLTSNAAFTLGTTSGGTATYTQDGGSITLKNFPVYIGSNTGTYFFNLSNGTFADQSGGTTALGYSGATTYNQSGGLFSYNPLFASYLLVANSATGPTAMNLSGGTFQVGANATLYLGVGAAATMNLGGGALVLANSLSFDYTGLAGTAVLNLNSGGTLQAAKIYESTAIGTGGTLTFNGGLLRAATNSLSTWIPASNNFTLNVTNSGAYIDTNGQNVTIAQPLLDGSGSTSDSLTKLNSGTLILASSAANTYQGTTTVNGGTLQIGNGGSGGDMTGGGPIVVNANATLAFSRSDNPAQGSNFTTNSSNVISGAGGLAQIGTGLLTLNATNTYSGPTAVSAGTLAVNGALTQTSTVSVGNAGTLTGSGLIGGGATVTTLTGNGTINLSGGSIGGPLNVTGGNWLGTGTVNGVLTSSSNVFAVANGGTLNAAGNMSLSGGTLTGQGTISGGTLTLGSGAAISPGTSANVNNVGTLTLPSLLTNGGGVLCYDFSNTNTVGGNVNDLIAVAGNLSLSGTTTLALSASAGGYATGVPYTLFTYGGDLSNSGTFSLAPGSIGGRQSPTFNSGGGSVTVTINGNNANLSWVGTGGVTTWVDNSNVMPWTSPTSPAGDYFTHGDYVTFNDTVGSGAVSISGAVSPGSLTVSNTNTNYTFGGSGSIAGKTSLVMNGPGALTINTSNTYAGGTQLNGGLLNLGNSAALAGGPLTINGGTLDNTGAGAMTLANNIAQSWNGDFTFNGTQNLSMGTGAVMLGGNRTVTVNANTLTVGGAISDGGNNYSLTLGGSGTLVLAASNGYGGGTTINGGTLQINNIYALGSGTLQVHDNATLCYSLSNATIAGGIDGSGSVIYSGKITLSGYQYNTGATVVSSGTLTMITNSQLGGDALSVAPGAGLALSNVTLKASTSLVDSGNVSLSSSAQTLASLDGGTAGIVTLKGTLLTVTNGGVFAGSIRDFNTTLSGRGSLISLGNLTLNGSNTYTNPTTVGAGTLTLGAFGTIGTGALTIVPGGMLDVSAYGTTGYSFGGNVLNAGSAASTSSDINGTLNMHSAALNVAGGSAGTMTITNGGLSLNGGTLNYVPGDLITMSGKLALTNTVDVALLGPVTGGTYTLFNYGSLTGGTGNLALVGPYVISSPSRVSYTLSASGGSASGGSVDLIVTGAAANLQWNGGSNHTWDADVSQSWTNLSGGTADYFYNGDNVTFNDTPGTAQTVTVSGKVQPGSVTFSSTNASYTLSGTGSIGGLTSLAMNGPGNLTINNSNSYTGGTYLNGGLLNLGNSAALGSGILAIGGGTLDNTSGTAMTLAGNIPQNINGNIFFLGGSPLNTGTGAVTLGVSSAINVSGTGALTIGGPISDGGHVYSLTMNGPGTAILAGSSSYSGGTNVNGGTLQIGNGPKAGSVTGAINIAGGGTLVHSYSSTPGIPNTFADVANTVSGSGTWVLQSTGGTQTGQITFNGDNTGFTGNLIVANNTKLTLVVAAAVPGSPGTITVQNGGDLFLATTASPFTVNAPLTLSGSGFQDGTGHAGALCMGGDALSGNITLVGNTGISAFRSTGVITGVISGGTNQLAMISSYVTSGTGGTDTLTLSPTAANSYGSTRVDSSMCYPAFADTVTLVAGNSGAFSSGPLSLSGTTNNIAVVSLNGSSFSFDDLSSDNAYTKIFNRNATTGSTISVGADNTSTTYSGTLVDGGSASLALTKTGTGALTLSGTNGYTGGTTVNGGTLIATNNGVFADGTSLAVGSPTLLALVPAPVVPSAAAAAAPALAPVPEPNTVVLLAFGLWSAAIYRRFRRRQLCSAGTN
jgi:autotransporter-associated beta strand protein